MIDENELERLMDKAGLGQRARSKMRKANEAPSTSSAPKAREARGHGSPSQDRERGPTM